MSYRMSTEAREVYVERRLADREAGCIRGSERRNAWAEKGRI